MRTAASVHLPDRIDGPITVLFGFPGGGFGRRYYDVQKMPGYSQAEHHTAQGFGFVACDHLGVGDSDQPGHVQPHVREPGAGQSRDDPGGRGRACGRAALLDGVGPIEVRTIVGMGQSMGGCLLTVQQAQPSPLSTASRSWVGAGSAPTSRRRTAAAISYPMPPRGTDLRPIADKVLGVVAPDDSHYRFCFHWPDEEPDLMEADLSSYRPYTDVVRGDDSTPWGSATVPACAVTMMTPGAVSGEAAAIDVPVLVGSGERDVVPDPWAEPTAYRGSPNVALVVIPRMAHMHNFAHTRALLWDAIAHFAGGVRAAPRAAR